MILPFRKLEHHPVLLFLAGMLLLTLFELLSSYFCDFVLGKSYWDYTGEFLNFQGRIALRSSIAWGALSVLGVKVFAPAIDKLYLRAKARKHFKIFVCILMLYAVFCALVKYVLFPSVAQY